MNGLAFAGFALLWLAVGFNYLRETARDLS